MPDASAPSATTQAPPPPRKPPHSPRMGQQKAKSASLTSKEDKVLRLDRGEEVSPVTPRSRCSWKGRPAAPPCHPPHGTLPCVEMPHSPLRPCRGPGGLPRFSYATASRPAWRCPALLQAHTEALVGFHAFPTPQHPTLHRDAPLSSTPMQRPWWASMLFPPLPGRGFGNTSRSSGTWQHLLPPPPRIP